MQHPNSPQVYYEIVYFDQFGHRQAFRIDDERHAGMIYDAHVDEKKIMLLQRVEVSVLRMQRWGEEWRFDDDDSSSTHSSSTGTLPS